MNLAQQRRLIAVSAMMVFALGFLSHAKKGELPTARFLIGTGGLYTVISVFADLGLAIGAGMSMVVLITAILTEGGPVIQLLNERTGIKGKIQTGGTTIKQTLGPNVTQRINIPSSKNPALNPKVKGPAAPSHIFDVPKFGP